MNDQDRFTRVMFVCMGNICRSPLAEGIFRHLAREAGVLDNFEIASSGTGGWHVGQSPDRRMNQVAEKNGVSMAGQYAQQFQLSDLDYYDIILAMDRDNLRNIQRLDAGKKHAHKIQLFREFDPEPGDMQVPDPYYGGARGFDNVFSIVDRTARVLLDRLSSSK